MQDYLNKNTWKQALIVAPKNIIPEWRNELKTHLKSNWEWDDLFENYWVYVLESWEKIDLEKVNKNFSYDR